MINRKLCVVVCCLGVGFAHVAQAQSSGGDDQSKALEALRQAEKGPAKKQAVVAATPAPAPAPASSDADNAQALDALRQAEKGAPIAAPANAAPAPATAPAVAAAPASPEDEARALEALHSAEQSQPQKPTDTAAAAKAKKEAEKAALRQKKADELAAAQAKKAADDEARQKQAAELAASQAQKEADQKAQQQKAAEAAEQLKQDQAAKKAAAQAKMAAKQQPIPAQYTANVSKPDDADTASARAALEQFEMNGGAVPENPERQSEVNALRRQHAQEEAAWRVEALQKQIKSQPAAAVPATPMPPAGSKEAKLADLLRRYNADEITPLEYHTERAKIVAEP